MIDGSKLRGVDIIMVRQVGMAHLQECYYSMASASNENLFPIQLTPKLLAERCGFHDERFGTVSLNGGGKEALIVTPNPLQLGSWLLCYKDVKISVDALHELQQAFYCLFRKELEII